MSKKYSVPVVAQPPKSNTCWHAASLMIWYYWQGITNKQGPMNTLAENYKNDRGASPYQFVELATKVGMKKVFEKYNYYTSHILENLLTKYGPLWCAGEWFGQKHIIVLTGIDGEKVFLNDPDRGIKDKTGTVAWFNNKLSKNVDGCLMYKDPQAY